jgi:dipeptidyl aminopeptidase/acylaminoacyl peptidase
VTAFDSLDDYIALPRVEALALSPDGRHVVLTVATLNEKKTAYERALWRVAADGSPGAVRLTRSAKGESAPAFTASGDLLFVSARSDDQDAAHAQVWQLPGAGGEARPVTALAGGGGGVVAAAASDRLVLAADLLPSAGRTSGADTLEDDARLRADRKKHKVAAILHEGYPIRNWDHDLGPDEPHLLALDLTGVVDPVGAPARPEAEHADGAEGADKDAPAPYPAHLPRPVDLTPNPGRTADTEGIAIAPDGATVVAALKVSRGADERQRLVAIDVASGIHTPIFDDPAADAEVPTVSNDGRVVAFVRTDLQNPVAPSQQELWVVGIDGSAPRRIAAGWDRWPSSLVFDRDDDALIVTADQDGRGPVFRVALDGAGAVQQLTDDEYTYSHVRVDRSSDGLVALRASWMRPSHPVRIARDGTVTELATPALTPEVPARITEVETTADDGARVRGWLLLPTGADVAAPAPLLLWIHGGPLNSWNAWSWRWNPQLAVARGYAVLLPDPALSTGYGLDFIARGWNAWGAAPYTDLMSITDAVVERDDIDETRTAAMGGSFGGYMANWVAGHTDRFRAIVTHASLWALDQFGPTTDFTPYWQSIFTPAAMAENSPHTHLANITSPMLVVHGDHDYRVPIGEGLRLWTELNTQFAAEDGSLPHRFLYFPDENHWVLKPQHAVVWYDTVFAFLAQHVLGEEWVRPDRLG